MLQTWKAASESTSGAPLLERGAARVAKAACSTSLGLWVCWLLAELFLDLVSAAIYSANEGWPFEQAIYASASISNGIGMPYEGMSEGSAVYSCVNALLGYLLLGVAASLLIRNIVMAQQKTRRELTVMRESFVQEPFRDEIVTSSTRAGHEREVGDVPVPLLCRMLACTRRGLVLTKRRRRSLLFLSWLGMWAVGFVTFSLWAVVDDTSSRTQFKQGVEALLWIVGTATTSSLGHVTPKHGFLWAALYIVVSVPLTAAVYAALIEVYLDGVERRSARRQLAEAAIPGRQTFLSMDHEAQSTTDASVDWGKYLEYRLRSMPGTVLHRKLLDDLKANFASLDRSGTGLITWESLEALGDSVF